MITNKQGITKLKDKVEEILKNQVSTRNCDILLTQCVWLTFYNKFIYKNRAGEEFIKLRDLKKIPSQDDIKRVRAFIQNDEKKYIPTVYEVAKKRKWKEIDWREYSRGIV